ncbi:NAD(P)-dependent oxidoreductase [Roseateles asaccharophilus]|uniref:Nucleoside-diphosphate-sugar epimerase n=1 Tax=Roseateles asaccharophilus TaxID=582607 RepID=A0ABU2AAC6_9BURK|nr:NAD(P)-dependent oxidoreductase [Roseateles asaccharophilus]MDR7334162.1 nucleoside-diphosphate-sugar epimerase [Roseateles asaccharophilus]
MTAFDPRAARCLVTGAAGYIGTRLRERSDSQLTQGYVALVRDAAVQQALQGAGRKSVMADLLQPGQALRALDGCDAVIHLAHGDQGPKATRLLVEAAIARKVRRFVHISTMSVHGPKPGTEAAREETARVGRYGDEYSDSKAEQEEIVQAAFERGDLPAVILRPTVVYGLGGHFERQIIRQALSGEVKLFDGGQGICNAVFVDDVCDAIEAALVNEDALGKPMFINSDDTVTWGQFIRSFASLVEPNPRFVDRSSAEAIRYWAEHPPEPVGGLPTRVLRKLKRLAGWRPPVAPWPPLGPVLRETFPIRFSNDRAKALLDWTPRVRFEEGVALTRDWLKAQGELGR